MPDELNRLIKADAAAQVAVLACKAALSRAESEAHCRRFELNTFIREHAARLTKASEAHSEDGA